MEKRLRKALKGITYNWARYNNMDILEAKANLIRNLENAKVSIEYKHAILKDQHYRNYF